MLSTEIKKDCTLCNLRAEAECIALFSFPRSAYLMCAAYLYHSERPFRNFILLLHFNKVFSYDKINKIPENFKEFYFCIFKTLFHL